MFEEPGVRAGDVEFVINELIEMLVVVQNYFLLFPGTFKSCYLLLLVFSLAVGREN